MENEDDGTTTGELTAAVKKRWFLLGVVAFGRNCERLLGIGEDGKKVDPIAQVCCLISVSCLLFVQSMRGDYPLLFTTTKGVYECQLPSGCHRQIHWDQQCQSVEIDCAEQQERGKIWSEFFG